MVNTRATDEERASRCSWDDTVRYAGRPKKSVIDLCVTTLEAGTRLDDCGDGMFDAEDDPTRNVSPAPSQSLEVTMGVCA